MVSSSKRRLVLTLLLAITIAAAALIGVSTWTIVTSLNGSSQLTIGGPFELTTQTGARLSDADLKGEPFAVFFGFTNCPEVCPTTLFEMSEALKELGPEAGKLKVLFVSVDSERDTPETLQSYLQSFDPRIVGLTGSAPEVEQAVQAYRVFWKKVPLEDGDYTIDHTASVYLMDAQGNFTGLIAYEEPAATRLQKLRALVSG